MTRIWQGPKGPTQAKRCPHCGETKPPEGFGWRSDRVGQLRPWCRECSNALSRKWNHETPEQARANERRWREANKERYLERTRKRMARSYAVNPEAQAERTRRWLAKHPEVVALYNHRRAARKRNAPGRSSREQLLARWAYYGDRCWMCGAPAEVTDHVIALSRGGSNWPANLRPACRRCNGTKGTRSWRVAGKRLSTLSSMT